VAGDREAEEDVVGPDLAAEPSPEPSHGGRGGLRLRISRPAAHSSSSLAGCGEARLRHLDVGAASASAAPTRWRPRRTSMAIPFSLLFLVMAPTNGKRGPHATLAHGGRPGRSLPMADASPVRLGSGWLPVPAAANFPLSRYWRMFFQYPVRKV
jgi:hypothetical protein